MEYIQTINWFHIVSLQYLSCHDNLYLIISSTCKSKNICQLESMVSIVFGFEQIEKLLLQSLTYLTFLRKIIKNNIGQFQYCTNICIQINQFLSANP